MRNLFIKLLLISGLFFCPIVIASQQTSVRYSKEPLLEKSRERHEHIPNYIPGQLIIKYKNARPDVEGTLDALEQNYGLGSRRKLFVPPPRKKVFPRRAKRKPKNFKKPNLENIYIINCADDVDVEALAKELMQDPQVEYAHPNYLLTICETTTNDTYFHEQWALKNTGQTGGTPGADIKASYAWDTQKGDPNILVGILDTGVDYTHPDLAANIWINPGEDHPPLGVIGPEDFNGVDDDFNGYIDDIRGWDFVTFSYTGLFWPRLYPGEDGGPPDNNPMDFEGHGTLCSGPLADSNNATGVVGVAWNCKIVPVRCSFAIQYELGGPMRGAGQVTDTAVGIYYAANNGIDILSMSFGFWGSYPEEPGPQLLKDAIDYAYSQGCVLVAAAGNYLITDNGPAMWDNVIAVAASDSNDQRSVWYDWGAPERDRASNYSSWVDVSAPGSDVYTTEVGGGYMPDFGGTSAATPHAAATAAMILSEEPNLSNEDVMWIMRRSADDIIETGKDPYSGYGRINVLEALNKSNSPVLKAKIDSPQVWAYISPANDQPVMGYAAGEDFNNYTLAYGVGKDPNPWMVLAESNLPVEDGILGYWDTNSLQRNFYTLKLSVTDSKDEDFEYRHTVLHNPDFAPGWPVNVEGCMYHSSLTAADIDDDNDMEILCFPYVLQSYREWGYGDKVIFAFHHDASAVSGWPKEEFGYVFEATPAIADIDQDGDLEVIVSVYSNHRVYAWHANGSSVTGWPQLATGAGFFGAATIYDLDGNPDNGLEVIAAATNEDDDYGKVYAWHADGTLVSGWPRNCYLTWSTPAVADVDADGKGEIFIGAYNNKMYAFNDDGSVLAGQWPITVGDDIFSSPAIADIDDDGQYEIIVGSKDHKVYAWNVNGTNAPGWPQTTNGIVWSSAAIGDIDGDGGLDVIVGSEDCNVYAWHGDGTPITGWPVKTGGEVKSSAAIGDIDGDGQAEVVIGSFDKNIYAFNGDGSIAEDWPILTTGTTFCTAAIIDVDNDGDVDLAFGSNDFKIYVVDINAPYDPNRIPWPMAHHDGQNTGCYPIGNPTVVDIHPANEGFVCVVRQIEVTFSEPVVNVSPDDLTLSVGTVVSVTGSVSGPYVFGVTGTQPGLITATLHGDIKDLEGVIMTLYSWTFAQTSVAGDIDCDGNVDFNDFALLASGWDDYGCEEPDWCEGSDIDHSTTVDSIDLDIIARNWLTNPFLSDLVGYWAFNEGSGIVAHDSSGNGIDGTIHGAEWVGGISGHGLEFDGVDDYVDCGYDNNLNITDEITVGAWVRRSSTNSFDYAASKYDTGNSRRSWLLMAGDNDSGYENDIGAVVSKDGSLGSGHSTILRGGSHIIDTDWHHLAFAYRFVSDGSSELRLYLDGQLDLSSSTAVGPIYSSDIPVRIGVIAIAGVLDRYFDGTIDEVRIYHRAFTGTEIKYLYYTQ